MAFSRWRTAKVSPPQSSQPKARAPPICAGPHTTPAPRPPPADIEPELTTRLAQWNLRIYEVPICYHGRTAAEGKKIGLKDAFEALWCLFKFRSIDTRFTTQARDSVSSSSATSA